MMSLRVISEWESVTNAHWRVFSEHICPMGSKSRVKSTSASNFVSEIYYYFIKQFSYITLLYT